MYVWFWPVTGQYVTNDLRQALCFCPAQTEFSKPNFASDKYSSLFNSIRLITTELIQPNYDDRDIVVGPSAVSSRCQIPDTHTKRKINNFATIIGVKNSDSLLWHIFFGNVRPFDVEAAIPSVI